jgi:peptidylprolyl isomerase
MIVLATLGACEGKSTMRGDAGQHTKAAAPANAEHSGAAQRDTKTAVAGDQGIPGIVAGAKADAPPTAQPAAVPVADAVPAPVVAADEGAPADVAAPPADAKKTASGLAYKVLTPGTGKASPKSYDKVEVHYTGWTTDGKQFDSSRKRGKTATFGVDKVIAGWTEGLQLMVEGESTRFWIPTELAYQGRPGAPAGMLVFDVELVKIESMPEPPKAPDDVAAPPADATKTTSGLAYKVLTPGKGKTHPGPETNVEVHYTGWTTDGKMFDSSVARGAPAKFPLNRVIAGWTEGLQLMVVGEKTRFWIPEDLAYKGRPGKPAGMLVFDVELISLP